MTGTNARGRILERIIALQSIDELDEFVGDLTDEEKRFVDGVDIPEPSDRELDEIDSEVVQSLISRVLDQIERSDKEFNRKKMILGLQGAMLMEMLSGPLSDEVAENLARLWSDRLPGKVRHRRSEVR